MSSATKAGTLCTNAMTEFGFRSILLESEEFLAERNGADAIDFLKSKLKNSKTNIEFLLTIDPDKLSSW